MGYANIEDILADSQAVLEPLLEKGPFGLDDYVGVKVAGGIGISFEIGKDLFEKNSFIAGQVIGRINMDKS